jgi:hypothetical protein
MIKILTSPLHIQEKKYTYYVVFKEFLGVDYQIVEDSQQQDTILQYENKSLILKDIFFNFPENLWLSEQTLPPLPLAYMNRDDYFKDIHIFNPSIPLLFHQKNISPFEEQEGATLVNIDLLGSIFFMLSRYEEGVYKEFDTHGRVKESQLIFFKENIQQRPLVNEYLEILKSLLNKIAPRLTFKEQHFSTFLSHDIDVPLLYYKRPISKWLRMLGHYTLNGKTDKMLGTFMDYIKVNLVDIKYDPNNTFDYIMNIAEKNNLKSAFYFITEHTNPRFHDNYKLEKFPFCQILKNIAERGHEIGLHASYEVKNHPFFLKKELSKLSFICKQNNIHQDFFGGRHHYLNWNISMPYFWDESGLSYDSTLGFHETSGFRTGTCYEYSMYDLVHRKQLKLKQKPLVSMDWTTYGKTKSMGLNLQNGEALKFLSQLKDTCKFYNGTFGLLWHNNELHSSELRNLFESIIKA